MCQTSNTDSSSSTERRVQAVLVLGDTVYFGGRFNQVVPPGGGPSVSRNHLAACSLSTGRILPWNPDTEGDSVSTGGGDVYALATDGERIYAGGAFDRVGGVPASGIVALPADPGIADPKPLQWGSRPTPVVHPSRAVKSLALSGRTLFAGGTFAKVNDVERTGLAA
ncbi:MAG: hypothetical protein ACRDKW_00035, partial [Actinomycetota bacterium]